MVLFSDSPAAIRCGGVKKMALFICAVLLSVPSYAEAIIVELTSLAGAYHFRGQSHAPIRLKRGYTYVFEGYSAWHPLRLSQTQDGKWQNGVDYQQGVTTSETRLRIEVTKDTPNLFYYCAHHPNMGGALLVEP